MAEAAASVPRRPHTGRGPGKGTATSFPPQKGGAGTLRLVEVLDGDSQPKPVSQGFASTRKQSRRPAPAIKATGLRTLRKERKIQRESATTRCRRCRSFCVLASLGGASRPQETTRPPGWAALATSADSPHQTPRPNWQGRNRRRIEETGRSE